MENKEGRYIKSWNDLKDYLLLHYDMLSLGLLEKLSKVISLLLIIIVSLMIAFIILIHFSFALVYELSDLWGSKVYSFLAVGGLYLIIGIFLYIFREKVFVNPIVKQLSKILFDDLSDNIEKVEEDEQYSE